MIPEGELTCIWMDAGLVAYKLCSYEFECERCPFDAEMRTSGLTLGRRTLEKEAPLAEEAAEGFSPQLMQECFYHRGHTWVRSEVGPPGDRVRVRVGVDAFAAEVLLRVKDVVLPQRGSAIHQGLVFCWVLCGSNTLPIAAPISGRVVAANPRLRDRPKLVNTDPYGEGWFVSVEPRDLERELAKLLKGKRAASWMANERKKFERLRSLLRWPIHPSPVPRSKTEVGVTMADGGERLGEVEDAASLGRYFGFITQFFL